MLVPLRFDLESSANAAQQLDAFMGNASASEKVVLRAFKPIRNQFNTESVRLQEFPGFAVSPLIYGK